jgi:hypothetical protein
MPVENPGVSGFAREFGKMTQVAVFMSEIQNWWLQAVKRGLKGRNTAVS